MSDEVLQCARFGDDQELKTLLQSVDNDAREALLNFVQPETHNTPLHMGEWVGVYCVHVGSFGPTDVFLRVLCLQRVQMATSRVFESCWSTERRMCRTPMGTYHCVRKNERGSVFLDEKVGECLCPLCFSIVWCVLLLLFLLLLLLLLLLRVWQTGQYRTRIGRLSSYW